MITNPKMNNTVLPGNFHMTRKRMVLPHPVKKRIKPQKSGWFYLASNIWKEKEKGVLQLKKELSVFLVVVMPYS